MPRAKAGSQKAHENALKAAASARYNREHGIPPKRKGAPRMYPPVAPGRRAEIRAEGVRYRAMAREEGRLLRARRRGLTRVQRYMLGDIRRAESRRRSQLRSNRARRRGILRASGRYTAKGRSRSYRAYRTFKFLNRQRRRR